MSDERCGCGHLKRDHCNTDGPCAICNCVVFFRAATTPEDPYLALAKRAVKALETIALELQRRG